MTTSLEKSFYSVYCACLSWAFVKFWVCASFSFGIECRMWGVIIFILDHCLSILKETLDAKCN